MLTDAALKHLRPKEKSYKVADRDGMYALVSTKGSISFRLDYPSRSVAGRLRSYDHFSTFALMVMSKRLPTTTSCWSSPSVP